jgi:DnaJ-domain-containing protein 1
VLLPVLLALTVLFGLLFFIRLGAAQRAALLARWPAVLLALAALFTLSRGGWRAGLVLGVLAALAWLFWPALAAPKIPASAPEDPADAEARAILGVSPQAGESEIRRAYRTRMAKAHPDQGGGHAEAARLTAARDRLLRRGR